MKRARLGILLTALAAIGLWIWIAFPSTREPVADESPPAEAAPVAAVAEEKVEAPAPPPVAQAAEAPAVAEQPAPRAKKADDPNAPFAFEETQEDLNERAIEREALGSRFARETADAAWTDEAGRKVAELLARGNLQSSALRAVDCRQTICRFVLASSTNTTREVGGLIQAARDLDDETWIHPEEQDDGTWGTEVFFPKQGYRLSGGGGRIDEVRRAASAPDQERSNRGG